MASCAPFDQHLGHQLEELQARAGRHKWHVLMSLPWSPWHHQHADQTLAERACGASGLRHEHTLPRTSRMASSYVY
jgi:hypothetical protein